MEIHLIIYLLFVHWVADFIFQDEKWALNKSKYCDALIMHTSIYSIVLTLAFLPILGVNAIYFGIINYSAHTFVDFVTSKIVAGRFANKYLGGPIPNFGAFTVIGFDQWIHYVILFISLSIFL